ncbi:hypothetical protein [Paenibacillus sp. MABNR03]|uniref:hypothetical protein n=1 Tax=Paenibacillus sp. MABNR03 TaxID=3142626 RepID=UPI003D2AEB4F
MQAKKRRLIWICMAVIVLSVASFLFYVFINDRPGGLSDQRMSKLLGMNETIRIPTGETPENAIQKFRGNHPESQIIYKEQVEEGMILFTRRPSSESSNLQVEYARKRIFGWKWGWGGGYAINQSSPSQFVMDYMSIPRLDHISTPFPMIFGNVLDPAIKRVTVESKVNGEHVSTEAKLVEVGPESTIWFVFPPATVKTPFEIKGFNDDGVVVTSKEIKDENDSGTMSIEK